MWMHKILVNAPFNGELWMDKITVVEKSVALQGFIGIKSCTSWQILATPGNYETL